MMYTKITERLPSYSCLLHILVYLFVNIIVETLGLQVLNSCYSIAWRLAGVVDD
jgi:hypothetical protein